MSTVQIGTGIWTDRDLDRWESPEAMLLYLYLWTNEHVDGTTGIGLQIGLRTILHESRLSAERFESARREIGEKVVWFDDGSYWVVSRVKHTLKNMIANPQGKADNRFYGARRMIERCPEEIRRAVVRKYPFLGEDGNGTGKGTADERGNGDADNGTAKITAKNAKNGTDEEGNDGTATDNVPLRLCVKPVVFVDDEGACDTSEGALSETTPKGEAPYKPLASPLEGATKPHGTVAVSVAVSRSPKGKHVNHPDVLQTSLGESTGCPHPSTTPPSEAESRTAAAPCGNGNGGDLDEEGGDREGVSDDGPGNWGECYTRLWGHVPEEWRPYLLKRRIELMEFEPALVLAHIFDIWNGRDRVESVDQANGRLFHRLSKFDPSDKHYRLAKVKLGLARRRKG